jgi:hypothetical protein
MARSGNGLRRRLSFFPAPLPDEHVFSVVARYHLLSANRNEQVTREALRLPKGALKAQNLVNEPARFVVPVIASETGTTPLAIAERHTLFPLFRIAIDSPVLERWYGAWAEGEAVPADAADEHNANHLRHDRSWRYCPACLADDVRRHGVAYWHVSHQVPGLQCCPFHPETSLVGACTDCGESRSTLNALVLPGQRCRCGGDQAACSADAWDSWLSAYFDQLRADDTACLPRTLEQLREGFSLPQCLTDKYRERVDELLAGVENRIGIDRLAGFFEWYANDEAGFRQRSKPNFLWRTMRDTQSWRIRHPLYYLTLLYAAGADGQKALQGTGKALH